MTKFETMDNMNTNFVALSEAEMMETEGGVVLTTILIGGTTIAVTGKMAVGAVAGTFATGYWIGRGLGYF